MKLTPLRGLALAGALAVTGVAASSLAQPASPPPMAHAGPGMGGPRMDPAEMAQRRAQHLRDALQLRPNQEPALAALTDALKPPEGMRDRMRQEHREMMGLTTPERLDRMRDRMSRRQAEFDRRAMAIKRFYAQLTPPQQKAFDAMGPMMMRGGMGGHRRGPMGFGGHGGHGGHDGPRDPGMAPDTPG